MAGDCPVEKPRGLQAQQKGSKSAGKWKKKTGRGEISLLHMTIIEDIRRE